jgi:hypothetical protein
VIPRDVKLRPLDRRSARGMASARLHADLRSIVLDVLGARELSDLPPDVATWVDGAAETAVSAVCDTSVSGLLDSIDATVQAAPSGIVARLAHAALRHDVGVD